MDERMKAVSEVFTKEQLTKMPIEDLVKLVGSAQINLPPGTKVFGTGVVKRADGTIKYDDPTKEGTYGE